MNPELPLETDRHENVRGVDSARWMVWIQVAILVHASTVFWTKSVWQWLTPFKVSQVYAELIAAVVLPACVGIFAWKHRKRPRRILLVTLSVAVFVMTLFLVLFYLLCLSLAYV